jgi:hypothetical protein
MLTPVKRSTMHDSANDQLPGENNNDTVDCENHQITFGNRSISRDSADDPLRKCHLNNQLMKSVKRSRSHDSANDQLPEF